uniref:Rab-GAP TBC domain-containing protein n=1 Tax=Strigamia maritima TaxID=126957 RepID=T1IJS9_STRMM
MNGILSFLKPLNPNPDSKWQKYFKDNEVLLQIDKDVRRLCPDISFFQQATEFPHEKITVYNHLRLHKRVEFSVLNYANVTRKGLGMSKLTLTTKKTNEEYLPLPEGQEAHWEVVERILFIYAMLNPGQSYVQGMNEIVGPIYYTFASNPNNEWREFAEADTFFCFTNLMSEIRDFFIKTLDDSDYGIVGLMNRLMNAVRENDFQLWKQLEQQELKPQFFSFRWLTLLLSQEFPLPDVIRVWDSLFADEKRFTFLLHVCCSIVLRDRILGSDFSTNMKMLQKNLQNTKSIYEIY